jgi:hypothetical protein
MSDLLQRFSPSEFILLVAVIGLIICILVGLILSYVKAKQRLRLEAELKKEMIQKGLSSEEINRILHPPIQIPNYRPFGNRPFPDSYSEEPTNLKPEIELAKFLTSRGLSLESASVAQDLQGFSSFRETIQLAILKAIRTLPPNVNLEEELTNLILCGTLFPTPDEEILTLPFCMEYLAAIRFLKYEEKQAVCDLVKSLLYKKFEDGAGYSAEDLITLLQTVSRNRIGPERNSEAKPIISPSSMEENRGAEISPQIELEMRSR